jgi:hypothetical protein
MEQENYRFPYVVVYSVKAGAVEIPHIHHCAQDWR